MYINLFEYIYDNTNNEDTLIRIFNDKDEEIGKAYTLVYATPRNPQKDKQ